jgi:hypothetical protein
VGQSAGCGLVYKLDPAGIYTVLYSFAGGTDGAVPYFAGVVREPATIMRMPAASATAVRRFGRRWRRRLSWFVPPQKVVE